MERGEKKRLGEGGDGERRMSYLRFITLSLSV